MIKAILNSWPVLLPVSIYLFWLIIYSRKKDIKVRDDYLIKKRRYMFYAIYSTGAIVIAMLLIYVLQTDSMPEKVTTPFW